MSREKKKSSFKGIVGLGVLGAAIYGLWSCGGLGFLGIGNGAGQGGDGTGSGVSGWLQNAKEQIEQSGEDLANKADEKLKELTGTSTPEPAKDEPAPTATLAPTDTPAPTNTPKPTNTPVPVKEEYEIVITGSEIVFDGVKVDDISSLEQKLTDLYNQGKQLPIVVDSTLAAKNVRNDVIKLLDDMHDITGVFYNEK